MEHIATVYTRENETVLFGTELLHTSGVKAEWFQMEENVCSITNIQFSPVFSACNNKANKGIISH